MKIFVMQGTTLAGKTEHGTRLARDLKLAYISSGDIARALMDAKTESLFKDGQLSPHDGEIRAEIFARMRRGGDFLLDGFPRTADHVLHLVNFLDAEMGDVGRAIVVVKLVVDKHVIGARVAARGRDKFDSPEIVAKRYMLYLIETQLALDYLARVHGTQVVVPIAVEQHPNDTYCDVFDALRCAGFVL